MIRFKMMHSSRLLKSKWVVSLAALMGALLAIIFLSGCIAMIHDISTDLDNPPEFESLLPLRKGASNPPGHGGTPVAEAQRKAYPDLAPLVLDQPMEEVFTRAGQAARKMGWEVIAQNLARGRIEAVATTKWLRFKDDVVVRIHSVENKTRVDVRSKSRVGKSDLGANARRIRQFLELVRVDAKEM